MRPYGYENDRVTIREPEAKLLREAAAKLLDGESLRGVTAWMNDAGARTPGGNGWQANVLRRVLMSPRIGGKSKGRSGRLQRASWPPILDDVTYRRVVDLFEDATRKRGPAPTKRVYLLTGGIARCGLCGSPLLARPNNTGHRGYVCGSGAPTHGCGRIRINADSFEQDVTERALARLLRDDSRQRLAKALAGAEKAASEGDAVIAEAEKKLASLGVDYADGRIGAVEFHAARDRLQQRIREARASRRLGRMLDNVAALEAEDLVEWWEGASLEQQRALLEVLLEKIEVHPASVRGSKLYDPSRIKLTWRRNW